MFAQQREVGIFVMIEFRRLPRRRIMAFAAIGAPVAFMCVILGVAAKTGAWRFTDAIASAMASRTSRPCMLAKEREAGIFIVIERSGLPTTGIVAAGAIGAA